MAPVDEQPETPRHRDGTCGHTGRRLVRGRHLRRRDTGDRRRRHRRHGGGRRADPFRRGLTVRRYDPAMSEIVQYEVRGRVALITLNRPEARNAVNGDVAQALEAAIDQMEGDDEVWVGVLQANTEGQANPVFCAGADLKAINSGNAGGAQHQARRLRRLRLPRAQEAGHRRRRRPGHGRRLRNRAGRPISSSPPPARRSVSPRSSAT